MLTRPVGLLLAALLALLPGAALACGMPFEARITYEQALLVVDGPRQQLVASVELRDAAPNAAVIFPVPTTPEQVDQPEGGDELFGYLKAATRPLVRTERRMRWGSPPRDGAAGAGAPGGVNVLGQETLGGYEVARLAADDASALQAWLDANGYSVPPAAQPILAAYVADGWSFVAVRLAAGAPDGSLAPLRISYTSDELVYPMRLGALAELPVSVDLFVLSANRVESARMETAFAGPAAQLDPAPPTAIAPLLGAAPYLTHLRARELEPAQLTSDFAVGRAASDEPYREEVVVYDDVYLLNRDVGFILAIACLMAVTPLLLGIAVFIRGRMAAVAPKREEPDG